MRVSRKLTDGAGLTWGDVIAMEPRLSEMLAEAQAVDGSGEHFCANAVWYRTMKERLCQLVGWGRKSGPYALTTSGAYDAAYAKIYDALPNCKDCWCW